MARVLFTGSDIDRVQATAGTPLLSAAGAEAKVYLDAAGTQLADIQNADGSANATATLIVSSRSELPDFLGPTSGTTTLYVRVDGGDPLKIEAAAAGQVAGAIAASEATARQTYAAVKVAVGAGIDPTGATDSSARILVLLGDLYAAGGGTLHFPPGTYRIDQQLRLPDDGVTVSSIEGPPPQGRPLRITGSTGPSVDGGNRGLTPAGTILDLRFNGTGPGKIDARYNGFFELANVTLTNLGAADTKPFVYVTNTTMWVHDVTVLGHSTKQGQACDQDAFVLGGVDTKDIGGAVNSIWQGYGTVIERIYFDRIRRGVWGRASVNGLAVRNSLWTVRCGATPAEAALELDGMSVVNAAYIQVGNVITDNIFEVTAYPRPIRIRNSKKNYFAGNGFYDYTALFESVYTLTGEASLTDGNSMDDAYYESAMVTNDELIDVTGIINGSAVPIIRTGNNLRNVQLSTGPDGGPLLVQPHKALADESTLILNVRRAVQEVTRGNADVIRLQNNGSMALRGLSAGLNVGPDGNSGVAYDASGPQRLGAGNLLLAAGSDNNTVTVGLGALRLRQRSTAARPAAATVGRGAVIFEDTLGFPIYSDGTNWRSFATDAVV